MSRNEYKWFLVQWNDGGFDVVHVRCLVNALHEQLNAGAAVMAIVKGERKAGILVSKSHDRNILDQIIGKVKNVEMEQDHDFSPSGSSWEPSDEDYTSDSDEKENMKKVRFGLSNMNRKSCTNETPKRKVLTPSHRANAIIPESMKKEKNTNTNNSSRHTTFAVASNSNDKAKSLQDLNRNIKKREITLNKVTINVEEIEALSKSFEYVLKKIREMQSPCVQVDRRREWPTFEVPIKHDEVDAYVPDHDNENDRSGSVESNRSDDNVLITNKFSIVNSTTSEESTKHAKIPKMERVSTENADTTVYNHKKYSQNSANNTSTTENISQHNPATIPEGEWVSIGSGKTLIHKDKFRQVKWKSYTIATRTLLLASFPRRILATHSLTGKKSPAFQNKPAKMCLDPKIISDIIIEIKDRFNVKENLIRSIITTKCADESKMYKARRQKKKPVSARTKKELTADNVIIENNINTT